MTLEKSARLMNLTWSDARSADQKRYTSRFVCDLPGGEEPKSDSRDRAKHPNREALRLY